MLDLQAWNNSHIIMITCHSEKEFFLKSVLSKTEQNIGHHNEICVQYLCQYLKVI